MERSILNVSRERDESLLGVFERVVEARPDAPLYSFLDGKGEERQSINHAALFFAARNIAASLQLRRLQGQPVLLLYPHGPEFIIALYGAILAGAVPVPLCRQRGVDWNGLNSIIRASRSSLLLTTSSRFRTMPEEWIDEMGIQVLCTDQLNDLSSRWKRPILSPSDLAFIQFTSGSTMTPRGVAISHGNILGNLALIAKEFGCIEGETAVSWLPFHHDMGLVGHVLQPLYSGIHNYFLAPVEFAARPHRWLSAISRYRATISGGPTFAYHLCCKRIEPQERVDLDLRCWRQAYCGSERIAADILRRFAETFAACGFRSEALYPCYGMAESTLFACGRRGVRECRSSESGLSYVSVGRTESSDIVIAEPETGVRVAEGAMGEIWVRSESVANSYFDNPVETARVFDAHSDRGEGGYLRTGDLGFSRDGELYFTGRLKNLIKRRGCSFHAEDIEDHVLRLMAASGGVIRCAAFEVPASPGENEDELVILLEHDGISDVERVRTHAQSARAWVLKSLGILPGRVLLARKETLPLTTSGKLRREVCRRLYLEGCYSQQ